MRKKRNRHRKQSWFHAQQMREGLALHDCERDEESTRKRNRLEEEDDRDGDAGDACHARCRPRSRGQERYLQRLESPTCATVVCSGPAGTGKTLFACQVGMRQLLQGHVDKLILTRPTITANENHGFLPGTLDNKMQPWMRPLMDIFEHMVSKEKLHHLRQAGCIEVCPIAYMRGRTFTNAWIVADEMQNATIDQMMMLLTRSGERTKLCITGDARQSDLHLRGNAANGLVDLLRRLRAAVGDGGAPLVHVAHVPLHASDIQRAPVVAEILTRLYGGAATEGGDATAAERAA